MITLSLIAVVLLMNHKISAQAELNKRLESTNATTQKRLDTALERSQELEKQKLHTEAFLKKERSRTQQMRSENESLKVQLQSQTVEAVTNSTPIRVATYSGSTVWDKLADCEASGNWAANTGNGFRGGLQFTSSTWLGHGGGQFAPYADQASRSQQIAIATKVQASQGWGAWPACTSKLGLR